MTLRELKTLGYEIGFRALLHVQTRKRDLRWFRGLQWHL